MKEKLTNGNLKIEEYSFHEFLLSFQQAVLEGYRLDLETNDNFPVKYGDFLSAILVEAKPVLPVQEFKPEPNANDTPRRKPKSV